MSIKFPLADEEEKAGDWILSIDFLKSIQQTIVEDYGNYDVQLEDIENVLLTTKGYFEG